MKYQIYQLNPYDFYISGFDFFNRYLTSSGQPGICIIDCLQVR